MRPQLLMSAVLIFIFGTMFACIASGRWLLDGEMNIINALASFNTVTFSAAGGWDVMKGAAQFFNAIATALSWNYPFLDDPWALFVKIPLWVISIGVVWAFIEVFISIIQSLASAVRSLIPGV